MVFNSKLFIEWLCIKWKSNLICIRAEITSGNVVELVGQKALQPQANLCRETNSWS